MRARYPDSDGYVERDGVKLFYEIYGEGDQTILFLPTWSVIHSRQWKAQIAYFTRHFRVLTFDGRGNGEAAAALAPAGRVRSPRSLPSGGRGAQRGTRQARAGLHGGSSSAVSSGLADTTIFVARESGRPLEVASLPDLIGVSVITIGELRAGVLAAAEVETRDRRLATLTQALALDPIPIDGVVSESWARLRLLLRDSQQWMPVTDSWIAATALALGVPVVTQDDDYVDVPGLLVIKV